MDFDISVSNLIENLATDDQRVMGYDLADFLIKTDQTGLAISDNGYPVFWD